MAKKQRLHLQKISENEFKSVLDRLDNEELKQRLKLAMASKSQDSSAPKVAKERDVAPVEFDIAGEDVANTTEEPIKQNRVVQPTPRVDGKEVCQVVKTLMGSHRRSAHRVNDNSLEVSDLENEAPSSFVVPFQVPNRNDRLIVHPQASFADRNGPYQPKMELYTEGDPVNRHTARLRHAHIILGGHRWAGISRDLFLVIHM